MRGGDAGFDEGEFLEKVPKQDLASIFKIMIWILIFFYNFN